MFEVRDHSLAARLGRLRTPHGVIETPTLFPVVNPRRQEVPVEEIREAGFNALITNAYLALKYFGDEAAEKGIHGILGFEGPVMTDSGAYQILQYGKVDVSPNEIIAYQKRIGSDIAVILDVPTASVESRDEAEETVWETLRRAEEALPIIRSDDRIWVLPIQGGVFLDLVELSASRASKMPGYSMYAIGSPTPLMEKYEFAALMRIIATAKRKLPPSKPVHLFGAGHPMMLPFAVALGIDTFDSASYILYARDGRYMTETGTLRLGELEEFPCNCPVCSRHTPRELAEMPAKERTRLLALHNLYVISRVLRRTRTAIREGRLWELLEGMSRAHPSLYSAFKVIAGESSWLELFDPRTRGNVKGLFFFDELSFARPKLVRYRRFIAEKYVPYTDHSRLVLLPGDPRDKPFTRSRIAECARRKLGRAHQVFYTPFYGVVPEELAEAYPLSQYEAPQEPSQAVIRDLVESIEFFLKKWGSRYSSITIAWLMDIRWSAEVSERITYTLEKVLLEC